VASGDKTGRLFVVDQIGLVSIIDAGGQLLSEPFLDVRDRMVELKESFDERGLLGFAFHPRYEENGHFFVYYSGPLREEAPVDWDHTSYISEFMVSPDNPNKADSASERVILQVNQPQFNHDGGQLVFGPDGYLYISLGDGGSANDVDVGHPPLGNGQDTSTLLGSILRIDVDGGDPYAIPADNPFVGRDGRDEIFAYGFRNPFRMSFDAGGDHDLFVGDVGQNLWEEVDIAVRGGNYGWNTREGFHCFDPGSPDDPPADCPNRGASGETFVEPIVEYAHPDLPGGIGLSVIGGYVYRGTALPQFEGRYIFGDWGARFDQGDGVLLVATPPGEQGDQWPIEEVEIVTNPSGRLDAFLQGFGQDAPHELYILTSQILGPTGETGKVYRLVPPRAWDGVVNEGEYPNMTEVVGVQVHWYNDTEELHVGLVSPGKGFVAIGFDPVRRMEGANIILGYVKDGKVVTRDDYGVSQTGHAEDTRRGGEDNVLLAAGRESDKGTVIEFSIPLDSGDKFDKILLPGETYGIIVSFHTTSDSFRTRHSQRGWGQITLENGD